MNNFLKTKKNITAWLDKYHITDYTLVPDEKYGYTVNVKGHVILYSKELTHIPVKFNKVSEDFDCSNNKLTSLEGCPESVGGNFFCSLNNLVDLKYCPKTVVGEFVCHHNQLNSLEFCPKKVGKWFHCKYNPELGELQYIDNFSVIYQEHLYYNAKKDLSYKLEKELDKSTKSTRIKI